VDARPAHERRAERATELRAAHAKLIADAGIPADQRGAVLDGIDWAFEVHTHMATTPDQSPDALRAVIEAAENAGKTKRWDEKLQQRIAALPLGLRFYIFEYRGYRNGEYVSGELPVEIVLARAEELQAHIQRGRGRPRGKLAGLLFALFVLFEPFFPDGVSKNTTEAERIRFRARNKLRVKGVGQDHLYSGPILDLVQNLLDVEGFEYESRGAIGRELWAFVQSAKKAERTPLAADF
jgi:hypothetical protein